MIGPRGVGRLVVLSVVVVGAVAACKRPAVVPDVPDATARDDQGAGDSGRSATGISDEPIVDDAGVPIPAAPAERRSAIAALLGGMGDAGAFPIAATDPGVSFAPSLRRRLTTVTVEAAPGRDFRERVDIGEVTASTPISDLDRVIAGLRSRFRACYRTSLNSDPQISGKLLISATVTAGGEVENPTIVSSTGVPPAIGSCVANVLKRAQFNPPGGKGATLKIPLAFSRDSSPL